MLARSDTDPDFIDYWQIHVNMLLNQAKSQAWVEVLPSVGQLSSEFPAAFSEWLKQYDTSYYDEGILLRLQNLLLSIEDLNKVAIAERDELERSIVLLRKRGRVQDAYGE